MMTHFGRHAAYLMVLGMIVCAPATGQTFRDAVEEGIALYRNGNFDGSAKQFKSILNQGYASAGIYYNLGNAYFRAGYLGKAILAYERARRLEPGDADVLHNLKLANLKTADRIDAVPDFFLVSWIRALATIFPARTTRASALVFWAAACFSIALLILIGRQSTRRMSRLVLVVALAGLIITGALLALQWYEASSREEAIIMSGVVTAKNSPDEQAVNAFVIHEGLKVRLSDTVGGWLKITLADGKVGWVLSQHVEQI